MEEHQHLELVGWLNDHTRDIGELQAIDRAQQVMIDRVLFYIPFFIGMGVLGIVAGVGALFWLALQ
jgi:hypothetical protein